MVRLMLTLTPVVCVCGAIVVSEILSTYLDLRVPSWTKGEDPNVVVNEVMSSRQRRSTNTPQETTGICLRFPSFRCFSVVFPHRLNLFSSAESRDLQYCCKSLCGDYFCNLSFSLCATFNLRYIYGIFLSKCCSRFENGRWESVYHWWLSWGVLLVTYEYPRWCQSHVMVCRSYHFCWVHLTRKVGLWISDCWDGRSNYSCR